MLITEPEPFITVAQLKKLLKKETAPDEDFELFAATACEVIRDRMGQVSPVTAVDVVKTFRNVLILEHTPIISVTTIVDTASTLPVTAGWALDGTAGILRHSYRFPGAITITYQAGRDPVPANFKLAALELGAHLWRSSQQNSGGGRPGFGDDNQVMPSAGWALPYNVRQLLGLDKMARAEVFI
jgi:hypothetical protein